jgi:hypothetical protein
MSFCKSQVEIRLNQTLFKMYKLKTQIHHFRFNSVHQKDPVSITWYKLNSIIEEGNEEVRPGCMSYDELTQITGYVTANKLNFRSQNYHFCLEENLPEPDEPDLDESKKLLPQFLVLRTIPQLNKTMNKIDTYMDIELLDEKGKLRHDYKLSFDIVGEIAD